MGSRRTAAEVEQEHLKVLGPELGPLYHRLHNECAWLQITWAQFVELFGTTPERVELLNEAAALFFRVVQDILWESTLLQLTRLTDPAKSAGKETLTVKRLPQLLKDGQAGAEVDERVKRACEATEFARDWRNRFIAHRDLALSLGDGASPLEPASHEKVKRAITAVCKVIECVHLAYFNCELHLDLTVTEASGAESLLYVIQDGLDADKARRKPQTLRSPGFPGIDPAPAM